ncbi:hypothetical protein DFJ58DRAFT_730088 [Suillus subalutaceus]|uniref:uncharacterized protein n=1 Tax=Suillus subalutaceus TaxID=48586 RepID=UPI001B874904|nr:uncharacterized protein DFJ58DRAFT_730088 [Suillus subalutaceus]KAG1847674.1 hypothetical protein DFJ58DRAFT_730088 [Suillus subalutaceus]
MSGTEDEIVIINFTSSTIIVRVTADNGDTGSAAFQYIDPNDYGAWTRSQWQVAFVFRKDGSSQAETMIVKPSETYQIT